MTETVNTIRQQLLSLGINRRLLFVAWDADTLKVSRGTNGALIRYNRATDLYDITEYHELVTRPLATGVYVDSLLDVIMPTFTPRVPFAHSCAYCGDAPCSSPEACRSDARAEIAD